MRNSKRGYIYQFPRWPTHYKHLYPWSRQTKSHFPIRFQDSVSIFTSTRAYTTWKFLPAAISCGKTRRPWARQCRLCRFSQLHGSRSTDVSHCHHWSAQCRSSLTNLHTHTTWVHYYNSLFAFTFFHALFKSYSTTDRHEWTSGTCSKCHTVVSAVNIFLGNVLYPYADYSWWWKLHHRLSTQP